MGGYLAVFATTGFVGGVALVYCAWKRCRNRGVGTATEEDEERLIEAPVAQNEPLIEDAELKLLEEKIETKKRQRKQLLKQQEELEKMYLYSPANLAELERRRSESGDSEQLQSLYKPIVQLLLKRMRNNLLNILTAPDEGHKGVPHEKQHEQKEKYKAYGLLLSACIKGRHVDCLSPEDLTKKFAEDYDSFHDVIEANVKKALSLTQSCLTLLPPLLVCQPSWYDEELQDTNRMTWNETESGPLFYHRPVLVYGNQFHVAVKGQVGNSRTVVVKEELAVFKEETEVFKEKTEEATGISKEEIEVKTEEVTGISKEESEVSKEKTEEATGISKEETKISKEKTEEVTGISKEESEVSREKTEGATGISEEESEVSKEKTEEVTGISKEESEVSREKTEEATGISKEESEVSKEKTEEVTGISKEEIEVSREKTEEVTGISKEETGASKEGTDICKDDD